MSIQMQPPKVSVAPANTAGGNLFAQQARRKHEDNHNVPAVETRQQAAVGKSISCPAEDVAEEPDEETHEPMPARTVPFVLPRVSVRCLLQHEAEDGQRCAQESRQHPEPPERIAYMLRSMSVGTMADVIFSLPN
eukprot:CAMPEP_0171059860 /NCGR_PEP_ID=MMETSP0766_2-20121228/3459_1 /TAXON_ID=439317 /ORGANISM="Gambierdiscus australes, Strain CAWD 149" /LENGTH=134 /DNA_ID=CAMNT_0011515363 /DNA_START=645 /DNA_END=1048 /DNA_ORIENTATION=+